ncbi:chorismate-binding protein [Salmonella enterica subsp. enterica]|nr:chorismate-binding protein [Salmonella enterica subsp. enterica]
MTRSARWYASCKAIRAGSIFQAPSRRHCSRPSPLAAYYVLKKSNPSPYMFLCRMLRLSLSARRRKARWKYDAASRQIGDLPHRGNSSTRSPRRWHVGQRSDSRIELDMRTDHKELSEHLMPYSIWRAQ